MSTLFRQDTGESLDVRVEDFLDDKFQSFSDLEGLDDLLANVELQRNQLQAQLDNAVKELEEARRTAENSQGSLASRIEDFQKLQKSIDIRVQIAAASDAPSQAIARLKAPMDKLRTVELTQKYLILVQDVGKLKEEAKSHLPASPKSALEPYAQLKEMSMRLREVPESESLYVVEYVEKITESLWSEMKNTMSEELEAVLTKRNWPKVDLESQMDEEWLACVEKLIDLQMPEILHTSDVVSMLPFDVMASIFIAEFRFHFLSDKPTSSPQSLATHCYPWFLTTVEKWADFFRDNLGHLLAAKFQETPVADNTVYVDPVSALITSLLPVMREKVLGVAKGALQQPSLLSDFVSKLLSFDENIRSRFSYDGGDAENGWPGLAAEVLDEHFDEWFAAERKIAMDRFETIMESADGRKIDYDYAGRGRMKPTYAAVRITDLLQSVTGQYDRLRKFKHKIRFLTSIQLDILDGYHDRLRGSLEAYQSITSTLGRTLHGASKEQLVALEGTGGLETLCKVVGSADHIAGTLIEWSDEEFFATLWDELQTRDAKRKSADQIVPNMSYADIKDRTSNLASGEEDGALFDETVNAYTNRRVAAEELLVSALADSHYKAFKSYMNKVQWTTVGDGSDIDDTQLSITPELDQPLHILKRNFEFLLKALSTASFRRVWHGALGKLQDLLWNSVLLRHTFTTLGAAQFQHDGAALFSIIEMYIPGGSGSFDTLRDGMVLLTLPTTANESNDGTTADGNNEPITLKTATGRAFKDNEEARKLLEQLGLRSLNAANARNILEKRVENSENVAW